MSLVLEALRKLDREKGRDERGFVVMAAAPWPTRTERRGPLWAAFGAAGAVIVGLVAFWISRPALVVPAAPASPTSVAVPPLAAAPAEALAPAAAPALAGTRPNVNPRPFTAPARGASHAAIAAPSAPADPGLHLQAISARDGQPIAIVNDHLVHVGDAFDGVRILAIRGMEVDVEVRGQRTTLHF
ncbi:MAG TPA: hypothetical protein VGQ33_02260 [Vicinamibacteria bacterium]|nr:hypothetical protein [Vicinamibacteria bacterium]